MHGNLSIADFLDKINVISNNLALAGSPMSDNDIVSIIMNNVSPLYETTVSSAQARDTSPMSLLRHFSYPRSVAFMINNKLPLI